MDRSGTSDIAADTLDPTLTMPSQMSPARAAVHWALPVVVAPLLFACAGVDEWPAAGRSTNPVAPVAARYQGEEAVPNPANPMVGLRFTGKPCDAVVRVDDSGAARVESSFVPGRAVGLTPVAHLTEERAEISERMVPPILEQARVVDDGGGIVLLDREPPP